MERSGLVHVASLVANAPLETVLGAASKALASECDGARALVSRADADRLATVQGRSDSPDGRVIAEAIDGRGSVRLDADGASAVAAAIVVGGVSWGALSAHARTALPVAAEARAAELAALVAAAVACDALATSRERILVASDAARRAFERRLHDGAQQRLVTLAMELRLAEGELPATARPPIARAVERTGEILDELREVSRALHPGILSEGGLRPALRALARRSPIPVKLSPELDQRFADRIELAAYHVVLEALAQATGASSAEVRVELRDGRLRVTVADDGANRTLTSLRDRVEAVGGALAVTRRAGGGTTMTAELPPHPR